MCSGAGRHVPILFVLLSLCWVSARAQDDYQLGLGYKLGDGLTVGGYFSTEYANGDNTEEFVLDDLAVLAYGSLGENFSFLAELESVNFYVHDFKADTSDTNATPHIERLYGDYTFSDYLSVRFGKQITPIGYWNLQPINVLRETTSNPLFSREMFPKFLTGLDFYGYTPFDEDLTYHVYLQGTQDLDDEYINIPVDRHYGLSLAKQISPAWHLGGSLGRYDTVDNTSNEYVELNSRWNLGRFNLATEGMINYQEYNNGQTEKTRSIYAQGEYHFTPKHAAVVRAEYFKNDLTGVRERIGILGYSFRPVFPVSLKVEYQWHADTNDNQVLGSFSVLF